MSDEYFDLIVWYEASNAIHGFQLCYDKPGSEHALTWLKDRGFMHNAIDSGDDGWGNSSPILLPDGAFPAEQVMSEFRRRAIELPKSLRNFVTARLRKFTTRRNGTSR